MHLISFKTVLASAALTLLASSSGIVDAKGYRRSRRHDTEYTDVSRNYYDNNYGSYYHGYYPRGDDVSNETEKYKTANDNADVAQDNDKKEEQNYQQDNQAESKKKSSRTYRPSNRRYSRRSYRGRRAHNDYDDQTYAPMRYSRKRAYYPRGYYVHEDDYTGYNNYYGHNNYRRRYY
jgi:hypothetical protein